MYLSCKKERFIFSVVSEENKLWPFLCLFSLSVPWKAEAEFKPFEYKILQKRLFFVAVVVVEESINYYFFFCNEKWLFKISSQMKDFD